MNIKGGEGRHTLFALLTTGVLISFLGWAFEKLGRYAIYGAQGDRGFLRLPLCPIYGISTVLIFVFLGTPRALRGVLGARLCRAPRVRRILLKAPFRIAIYFALVTLFSTAAELVTGLLMRSVGVTLWDYSERTFNLFGVICPSFSLLWGVLISAFMYFCWDAIFARVRALPPRVAAPLAFTLTSATALDFIASLSLAIARAMA